MTITYTDGGRISELILAGRQARIATLADDITYSLAAGELDIALGAPFFVGPTQAALEDTSKHVTLDHWVTDIMMLYWFTSVGATATIDIVASSNDYGICSPGQSWSLPSISGNGFGPTTWVEKSIPIWAMLNADNLDGVSSAASYRKPAAAAIGSHVQLLTSLSSRQFMLGANPAAVFSTDTQNFNAAVGYLDPTTSAGNQTVDAVIAPLPGVVCPWFTFTLNPPGTMTSHPNFTAHFRIIGIHME